MAGPMSVRFRLIALVLVGLMAAAVTAYWFHAAGQVRKGLDAFTAQLRTEGWRVDMDSVRIGGFPIAVVARLEGVDLRSPAGLSWHGDRIAATIPLLTPLDITVDMPGAHILAGFGWSGVVSAATARTRLRLHPDGRLAGFAVTAETLALEQPGIDPLTLDGATITYDDLAPADPGHATPSVAMTLALRGLGLPDISGSPLPRRVDAVQVEARVMGTMASTAPLAALAAWSKEGGTIELDRLALDWSPLSLEADGTLALDADLQPLIAISARIRGAGDVMVRLARAGLVEPRMASTAQVMLTIMARPDAQGRSTLFVPLTLQDGLLSAGQVRLLRVPRLPIPAPGPGEALR